MVLGIFKVSLADIVKHLFLIKILVTSADGKSVQMSIESGIKKISSNNNKTQAYKNLQDNTLTVSK